MANDSLKAGFSRTDSLRALIRRLDLLPGYFEVSPHFIISALLIDDTTGTSCVGAMSQRGIRSTFNSILVSLNSHEGVSNR
jgi:hypothetical protein